MPTLKKSITHRFTENARTGLMRAQKISALTGSKAVTPEHILYGIFLTKGCVGAMILKNTGFTKKTFESILFPNGPLKNKEVEDTAKKSSSPLTKASAKSITDAFATASQFGYPYVGTEHITHAILQTPTPMISKMLHIATAQKDDSKNPQSKKGTSSNDALSQIGHILGHEGLSFLRGDHEESSIFESYTDDTAARGEQQSFYGYQEVCDRVATVLGRRTKNNPLLVGDPGVGKTALIEHLAHLARTPDAPHHLRGKKILTLDLALLIAGTSFRGEFEQRLKDIILEAQQDSNIILFIDEIHTIIGTGNANGSLDVANILKPALARGDVTIIGATTHEEYKKHIEKDAALSRRFQTITLTEPTLSEVKEIITASLPQLEQHHHIVFSPESIDATITYAERYLTERFFPDKAFDVIDETAARLRNKRTAVKLEEELFGLRDESRTLENQKKEYLLDHSYDLASNIQKKESLLKEKIALLEKKMRDKRRILTPTVKKADIAQTVALTTGIPLDLILENPQSRITTAAKNLKKKIIGQDHAMDTIARTLLKSAYGIQSPRRPQGSFLLAGPSGVGKTETARILANDIFGSEDALIRIDMSELSERHTTSKLIGAPAGYIGYGEGGTLTEKMRRKPYSIVLFDEIEKAHPDVITLLLQILDDGTLTDGEGRSVSFRNSIIILTSNAGIRAAHMSNLGFEDDHNKASAELQDALSEVFPPELLGRLDHIITYHKLTAVDLTKIARLSLSALTDRLAQKQVALKVETPVYKYLATRAEAADFNARSMDTLIQEEVEPLITDALITNKKKIILKIKKNVLALTAR